MSLPNATLLDDVALHEASTSTSLADAFPTPSPSHFFGDGDAQDFVVHELLSDASSSSPSVDATDDPFPMPMDPFQEELNITGHMDGDIGNATDFHLSLGNIIEYVSDNSWLIYLLLLIGTLIVISVVVGIVHWLYKHKKRVIRQEEDPVLTSAYDQDVKWKKLCCCCCKTKDKEDLAMRRQNSASNLDPYRRPPLPSITTRPLTLGDTATSIDENGLAVHIDGIRGVPTLHLRPEQFRKLPPLQRYAPQ